MSGESSIQWCDATWNPTRGCSVISEGCHNCYAMRQAHRFNKPGGAFEGYTKATKGGPQWTGKVSLVESALDWPLRYKGHPDALREGRPTRIFVNSMSDLFHESLSDVDIDCVFAVMALAPQHTFQVLTKRAKRMRDYVLSRSSPGVSRVALAMALSKSRVSVPNRRWDIPFGWPIPNVWLGVSAENQERADERIPDLLATPAAVRFVSAEPLLGPLNLRSACARSPLWMPSEGGHTFGTWHRGLPIADAMRFLDWVIVGGESGPKARPCSVEWIRSIKEQCKAAGVPVFVKQIGSNARDCKGCPDCNRISGCGGHFDRLKDSKGGDPSEWPEDLRVREMPEGGR